MCAWVLHICDGKCGQCGGYMSIGRPKRFLEGCGKQSASEHTPLFNLSTASALLDRFGQGQNVSISVSPNRYLTSHSPV